MICKYKESPFIVSIFWVESNKICKREFKKYLEAVAWANKNLAVDKITVKILGQLILENDNVT